MLELNEQELEQVAGGHGGFGSTSTAFGDAYALAGAVVTTSDSGSIVTHWGATSAAANTSAGIGLLVGVDSGATTSAGASSH